MAVIAWFFTSPAAGAEPAAPVMAPEYRSALADYAPYREGALADWREINAAVENLGGHMGHVRQAGTDPAATHTPHPGGGTGR